MHCFSISHYFPCMSHLLPQKESVSTPLATLHQQPNYQKQARASVVKSTYAQQQQTFCSDHNISSCPTNTAYFKNISRENKQTKEMEKSSASCPRYSKSENATTMILVDKETSSPMIMPK